MHLIEYYMMTFCHFLTKKFNVYVKQQSKGPLQLNMYNQVQSVFSLRHCVHFLKTESVLQPRRTVRFLGRHDFGPVHFSFLNIFLRMSGKFMHNSLRLSFEKTELHN
jgi:hypothetical protein